MNNMEIKVGDKVRVREDAPKIFLLGWYGFIGNVVDIEDSYAKIECNDCTLVIPTKYLVKVDAEAKEAKFKVGQLAMFKGRRVEIIGYSDHSPQMYRVFVLTENYHADAKESDLEPYTEPTEQTEAEKSFEDQLRDVLNGVEHQDYGHPIQTAMINLDINDWDAYTADLAKEVALKVANKYNAPEQAAEYAVSVAKSVVENLKKK